MGAAECGKEVVQGHLVGQIVAYVAPVANDWAASRNFKACTSIVVAGWPLVSLTGRIFVCSDLFCPEIGYQPQTFSGGLASS